MVDICRGPREGDFNTADYWRSCGILVPMKKTNPNRWFPIVIEKDEDGFFVAVNPSLAGCYSQGKTIEEALVNVQEATELCLESTNEKKEYQNTQVSVHLIAA